MSLLTATDKEIKSTRIKKSSDKDNTRNGSRKKRNSNKAVNIESNVTSLYENRDIDNTELKRHSVICTDLELMVIKNLLDSMRNNKDTINKIKNLH